MKINVRLFAGAAQVAGTRTVEVEVSDGADVAAVRDALLNRLPQLKALCDVSLWATDTEVLDERTVLKAGSELAMIPPVSGG